MGAHDFENNKVPFFGRKTGKINTSMSAAPKLALVPASRYFISMSTCHTTLYMPSFIRIERGLDGNP